MPALIRRTVQPSQHPNTKRRRGVKSDRPRRLVPARMSKPASKDDALNRLAELLWLHFPDDPQPVQSPSWQQRPYQDDLFELCRDSLAMLNHDDVNRFARDQWNIQRVHPLDEESDRQLNELLVSWRAWRFALRVLQK